MNGLLLGLTNNVLRFQVTLIYPLIPGPQPIWIARTLPSCLTRRHCGLVCLICARSRLLFSPFTLCVVRLPLGRMYRLARRHLPHIRRYLSKGMVLKQRWMRRIKTQRRTHLAIRVPIRRMRLRPSHLLLYLWHPMNRCHWHLSLVCHHGRLTSMCQTRIPRRGKRVHRRWRPVWQSQRGMSHTAMKYVFLICQRRLLQFPRGLRLYLCLRLCPFRRLLVSL